MPARLRVLLVGLTIPLALFLALPMLSHAGLDDRSRALERQIARKQRIVERKRGTEQRLQGQISHYNGTIGRLQTRIGGLQERQDSLQTSLDAKLAKLARTQEELRLQRARLVRLRTRLAVGRRVLGARLIELYKAGQPDLMTVILDSNGFADLLERSEFLSRVSHQDRRIIVRVQTDKADSVATTKRLAGLERSQTSLAQQILGQRNQVSSVREQVSAQRDTFAQARDKRGVLLDRTQTSRKNTQEDVASLQAENDKIQSRLQSAAGAGPVRRGSGALIWPVNGPITSPFCERRAWEACHPGIDIGVPSGTPIRAAGSGRVSIAGPQGGYGNFTCIQHGGALSTCYGHQSSIGVSVGQSVSQGQVIGRTGCTGLCFGPHLHFETRVNGAVQNPMNYL
jgi:murein DD-endopeptidase MepM/ murein hydrolase activator NlpD